MAAAVPDVVYHLAAQADVVVLATGYKDTSTLVARLFGNDVAEKVGPIWGFGADEDRLVLTSDGNPDNAQIVGNLVPEDDYTHELGPEPNFNESMYFNVYDPSTELGGFFPELLIDLLRSRVEQ